MHLGGQTPRPSNSGWGTCAVEQSAPARADGGAVSSHRRATAVGSLGLGMPPRLDHSHSPTPFPAAPKTTNGAHLDGQTPLRPVLPEVHPHLPAKLDITIHPTSYKTTTDGGAP